MYAHCNNLNKHQVRLLSTNQSFNGKINERKIERCFRSVENADDTANSLTST